MSNPEDSGDFGTIDLPALRRIRDLWLDIEPLVERAEYDDPIDPTAVRIPLDDGIADANSARIDVQWSRLGNYSYHYVDSQDVNWRFDRHPNDHSPACHFHPPPDADRADAVRSCITVEEVSLVTRAVHKMWRAAYSAADLDRINSLSNPP
jgi:hypothetical protein